MTHLSSPAFSTSVLESVGVVCTIHDAIQALREACTLYGFRHFSVIALPITISETPQSLAQLSIMSSLPAELSAEYDRLQLASDSPILSALRTKISPVLIDIEILDQEPSSWPKHLAAKKLFSRFKLTMGVSFPVNDAESQRYAVSFLGSRDLLSDEELSTLAMFSTILIEQVSRILAVNPGRRSLLNPREIEILQWTAEGKTSAEISRITGLSEHTVNHYATLSTKKLECSNRTQAVVEAMRMGLFR